MGSKLYHRKFLTVINVAIAVFLMVGIMNGRTMARDLIKIPEAEKIIITVVADNYTDAVRPDYKIAKRPVVATSPLDVAMHAEHGLAYHVETIVNNSAHSFLFDFGTDYYGVKKNLDLLKINLNSLEAIALSHDHFDHQGTLVELLGDERNGIPRGIPFFVGRQTFIDKYYRLPDGRVVSELPLKREEVERSRVVKIVEIENPTQIVPGAYLTGTIEMVMPFEKPNPACLIKKGDQFVQDGLIGEQAVILNVKGKGLVVISACAHRGIVNTVKYAQKITGIRKVHAIIGGFHLTGAEPEIIQKTIAEIKAINPDYIIPIHCTGFETVSAFAREMPDQFILNTVGTRYIITE